MDMNWGILKCMLLVMMLALSTQITYAGEDRVVGISLGQPLTLVKGRHLLAIDCSNACGKRCAVAGVKDRCLNYCNVCCKECQCVPSGTYGHKDECPCYRDKKNSKGKAKCP
ncbi:hypothetical protein SUGI_0265200 [Cryptomeria japonica]|uniref:peamaclein n=1 Tax=Cryptomeria japonica TaxID=3369 RepID=UPI002408CBE3|nr:peamaclein [Cryptomeria japonica]GLJ16009.1 hypothetical protein SUGI_0265200 [Cryptomeria japonica]